MRRFRTYDLVERFQGTPPLLVEAAVAGVVTGIAAGTGLLIQRFDPGIDIVLLAFSAVVAATLLAGSRAGLMAVVGCQCLGWSFLLAVKCSVGAACASDRASLVLAAGTQLLLLWFLTCHRTAERDAADRLAARSRELEAANALLRQGADARDQRAGQEAELQATRQNLEAIYQASGDGLALCEAIWDEAGHVVEYQVLEVNRAHAELTGATRTQMLANRVSTIYPPIDPRWFETAEKVLKTGMMHNFDIRSRATGRWLNIRVSRVSETLFQQTFVDVTDRLRLEEQRREMLKEMSHRVMNNFQMIAGFLHIQAGSADAVAKSHLRTAERRVQVLAKLHSLLAYTESEKDIDAAAYVQELCGYLTSTIERPDAVTLVCKADELRLPTEKVVPLGFVVSELVTNSAKYAYPPPMSGAIHVRLAREEDGWTLTIQDEGQGLQEVRPAKPSGLGTRLVDRFIRQIGAELVTTSDRGVRNVIRFRSAGDPSLDVSGTL